MSIIPDDKKEAVKELILSNCTVDVRDGCWDWIGPKNNRGYGYICLLKRTIHAHRANWIVHRGDIPPYHVLRRTCGNRLCCNPAHMQLHETKRPPVTTIEEVYIAVCQLNHCARAVDAAKRLGLPGDRETLESLETLLENPDHFKPLVKSGKKYYQAI